MAEGLEQSVAVAMATVKLQASKVPQTDVRRRRGHAHFAYAVDTVYKLVCANKSLKAVHAGTCSCRVVIASAACLSSSVSSDKPPPLPPPRPPHTGHCPLDRPSSLSTFRLHSFPSELSSIRGHVLVSPPDPRRPAAPPDRRSRR